MKYIVELVIITVIFLCGVALAEPDDELEAQSNQLAANVTTFIVNNVMSQAQNGTLNSSSFNSITNDAVTMAINEMAKTNNDIQPINKTVNVIPETANNTMTNETVIPFEPNNTSVNFIDSLLNIINSWCS